MWRALAAAAVLAVAACSSSGSPGTTLSAPPPETSSPSSSSPPEPFEVDGDFLIPLRGMISNNGRVGQTCVAKGNWGDDIIHVWTPWDDVKHGAQVVVKASSGRTIGVGKVGYGTVKMHHRLVCAFSFTVPDVPQSSRFYGVKVARQPMQQFPLSQMIQGPQVRG